MPVNLAGVGVGRVLVRGRRKAVAVAGAEASEAVAKDCIWIGEGVKHKGVWNSGVRLNWERP